MGIEEKERCRRRSGLSWAFARMESEVEEQIRLPTPLECAFDNGGKTCCQTMQFCISRKGDVGLEGIVERLM